MTLDVSVLILVLSNASIAVCSETGTWHFEGETTVVLHSSIAVCSATGTRHFEGKRL